MVAKEVERYHGAGAVDEEATGVGERAVRRKVARVVRTARRDCGRDRRVSEGYTQHRWGKANSL